MEARFSLFPTLQTDTLAPEIAQVFWPLCTPSTREHAAALKAVGDEHTGHVRLIEPAHLAQQRRGVEAMYEQRQKWVAETSSTVDAPNLRLTVVFGGS